MRKLTDAMWFTWEQGKFVGENRPVTRAAISKTVLRQSRELFRTLLFSDPYGDEWAEVPNLKTVNIDRRVDSDAATMSLSFSNVQPPETDEYLDEGYDGGSVVTKRDLREIGSPGAYTYRRGLASAGGGEVNPWHHVSSQWVDMFLPNRVIKTFQGYGTDESAYPWDDTKLELTGIWLIDSVEISASSGDIEISCRDAAKLLIEQRAYPPIIPLEKYPLHFVGPYKKVEKGTTDSTIEIEGSPATTGPNVAVHKNSRYDSSADPWYGYNASVYGHRASHAFDGDASTYWISMRNSQPSQDWSYEWLDAACNGEPINRVRFKPWKGNYTLYVCVMEGGKWQGDATVPYNPHAIPAYPNTANTKYVKKINMPAGEEWMQIDLDRIYNANYVRLTFTDLQWFGKISGGDYRAGVREFEVYGHQAAVPDSTATTTNEWELEVNKDGNIDDYVDIIKLFLAWSGFYWPTTSGTDPMDDPLLLRDYWGAKGGRVWGDFFYSGAYPIEPPTIDASYWDNKSVMDCINQIKEILGFIGYVDPSGGFILRPPNIWKNGNYIAGTGYVGESSIPVVTEDNVLLDYGAMVDDSALRSEIVVVSSNDPSIYGSFAPGYAVGEESPTTLEATAQVADGGAIVSDLGLLAGQQRVMLVPDYPFGQGFDDPERARAEVEKFAYLVSLWIHWSYRKSRFRIPGNPGLEIDDQIRIFERITSETYIHYIMGVRSTMDMEKGTWYMDVETHWLGNGPDSAWHMYLNEMTPALVAYLCAIDQLPDDMCNKEAGGTHDLPDNWFDWEPVDIPAALPRDPEGLREIFPNLPDIQYTAPDYDYNDPPDSGDTPSGSGVITPPSPGSGGLVLNCTNGFFFSFWPGTGPNFSLASNRIGVNFYGAGGSYSFMQIDRRCKDAFYHLSQLFIEEGITVNSASGKVIREVDGHPGLWSNHSWGVAADINSGVFWPWGKSIYELSPAVRQPYLNVAAKADAYLRCFDSNGSYPVFKWGQNFSKKDPMHWQVCTTPSRLAGGVWDIRQQVPT